MLTTIAFLENLVHWLEKNSMPCFYKKYLGIECPGCGMQRSIIELLKGNFLESFRLYPALLTTITLITLLILHIIFKFRNGAKILLIIFMVNTVVLLANYILKLTI